MQSNQGIVRLYESLPENERIITDILREIIAAAQGGYCNEKISFGVPYFYGKKGICIVWPANVPRGGIKKGVLLGFWYGNRLNDTENYLVRGTNKQIFYRVYQSPEEIHPKKIIRLLKESIQLDKQW